MSEAIADTKPLLLELDSCSEVQTGKRVCIALATYNGAKYLAEQIASIQQQSFADWILFIRDDFSNDGTLELLELVAAKDSRLHVIHDGKGNLGAIGNFSILMETALAEGADYLFFADQDDVWHPEKLATMLVAMRNLEALAGSEIPLLAHSDLEVVDEAQVEIAESFVRYSMLSPDTADLGVLLCQNQVTGCAAVINRRLLELACPVPERVLMHDWWLAQLAAAAGKIGYVPDKLVKYRQHGANVLGAISLWSRTVALLTSSREWEKFARLVSGSVRQAQMVLDRLSARGYRLSRNTEGTLKAYANLFAQPRLQRPLFLRRWKIGKPGRTKGWVFNMVVVAMKGGADERMDA